MSREHKKRRAFQIKRKQKRKEQLHLLKEKYLKATEEKEKQQIKEKMFRIAPWLEIDKYLSS